MKKLVMAMVATLTFATTAFAEDSIQTVFEQIDDLVTRIESGISLNSFAESYSEMKKTYNKAMAEPERNYNYVLSERMKDVFKLLDSYSGLWRIQDIDQFKFTPGGNSACYVQLSKRTYGYDIACQKQIILTELKPIIERSKSAHHDGW